MLGAHGQPSLHGGNLIAVAADQCLHIAVRQIPYPAINAEFECFLSGVMAEADALHMP